MALNVGCPFEVGETFAAPMEALELELEANVRAVDRGGLREVAESMARVGQLAPILVYWTGERFRVAAGYRRALAMATHREQFGFVAILARRIDAEAADLVRLVENFERENPSTFETCRYLYELQRGLNGRRKTPASEIAEAIGRSTHYVQNLIRFYRVLPEQAGDQQHAAHRHAGEHHPARQAHHAAHGDRYGVLVHGASLRRRVRIAAARSLATVPREQPRIAATSR
jgi:ParB/RepB/Spo0J family partition protein